MSEQSHSDDPAIWLVGIAWQTPTEEMAPFAALPAPGPLIEQALRDAGLGDRGPGRLAVFGSPATAVTPPSGLAWQELPTLAEALLAALAALRESQLVAAVVGAEAGEEGRGAWLVFERAESAGARGAFAYAAVRSMGRIEPAVGDDEGFGWSEPAASSEAAGAVSLARVGLALGHRVLPGGRPWIHPLPLRGHPSLGPPRRAAWRATLSDGGSIRLLLEETTATAPTDGIPFDHELFLYAADAVPELRAQLTGCLGYAQALLRAHAEPQAAHTALARLAWQLAQLERPAARFRLGIVAGSLPALCERLGATAAALSGDGAEAMARAHRPSAGVHAGLATAVGEGGARGQTAFLFPGLGAAYPDMLRELCWHFPAVREVFDSVDYVAAKQGEWLRPSQEIFPAAGATADLTASKAAVITLLLAEWALAQLLRELGIAPDCLMGCSTGEFAALCQGGATDAEEAIQVFYELSLGVARRMPAELLSQLRTVIAAAPATEVTALIGSIGGPLYVSADLGSDCTLLVGEQAVAARLCEALSARGRSAHLLPKALPYHTPLLAAEAIGDASELRGLTIRPPQQPIWSCATTRPYAVEPEAILAAARQLFARPIALRETVLAMHAAGVRTFIEVGPSDGLTRRVGAILREQPHAALSSNVAHRSGLEQLLHLLAALHARGHRIETEPLFRRRSFARPSIGSPAASPSLPMPARAPTLRRPSSGREIGTALPSLTLDLPQPGQWTCVRLRRSALPPELRATMTPSSLRELAARRAAQDLLQRWLRMPIALSAIEGVASPAGLSLRGDWSAAIGGELAAASAVCACGEVAVALVAAPALDARLGLAVSCWPAGAELAALQVDGAVAALSQIVGAEPLAVAAQDPLSGWTALRRGDDAALLHTRTQRSDGHLITRAVLPARPPLSRVA